MYDRNLLQPWPADDNLKASKHANANCASTDKQFREPPGYVIGAKRHFPWKFMYEFSVRLYGRDEEFPWDKALLFGLRSPAPAFLALTIGLKASSSIWERQSTRGKYWHNIFNRGADVVCKAVCSSEILQLNTGWKHFTKYMWTINSQTSFPRILFSCGSLAANLANIQVLQNSGSSKNLREEEEESPSLTSIRWKELQCSACTAARR